MSRSAAKQLEQGRARRGERFEPVELIGLDGKVVYCPCGSRKWRRDPLRDKADTTAYECDRECGRVLEGR